MLFLSVIFGVLVISSASNTRNCDDCIKINQCIQAMEFVATNRTLESTTLLRKAYCGVGQDRIPKVCCSDFSINGQLQTNIEKNNEEIEHHPNTHLLPMECGRIEQTRILVGQNPTLHEFPWIVLIARKSGRTLQFHCAGTLINEKYVLTSAQCIKNQVIPGVRVGCYDTSDKLDCNGEEEYRQCIPKYQDVAVSNAIIHPDFMQRTRSHNIGLLRLKKPVDFSFRNVGAICLPVTQNLLTSDIFSDLATCAGWAKMSSDVLLKTNIPILSPETCRRYYNRNQNLSSSGNPLDDVLCAGSFARDSCVSDPGGPLMLEDVYNNSYRFIQYGIWSHGTNCGVAPDVYTDLRKFMKWILDTIEP